MVQSQARRSRNRPWNRDRDGAIACERSQIRLSESKVQ